MLAVLSVCALGLALAACASPQPLPRSTRVYQPVKPTPQVQSRPAWVGKPYVVNGRRYVPHSNPNYDVVGTASWYGPKFHRRRTANGERFDMYGLTAAHKTLPFGTRVWVTNLRNGRSLVLRINDRGPFVGNRVIDVSYGAAKRLGFLKSGLARVRVRIAHRRSESDPATPRVQLGQLSPPNQ